MSTELECSPSEPSVTLALLDKALELQTPLTERHITRLRRNRPDATPDQIVDRLNAEFRAATISSGAAVGAIAAAPGVGTAAALAVAGGEAVPGALLMTAAMLSRYGGATPDPARPEDASADGSA